MSAPAEDRTPSDVEELRQTIAQGLDSDPFAEKWEHEDADAALRTLCDHVARLTAELADYALLKQAVNHSADCGPTCTPDGCAEDCPRLNTARWLTDQQREITRLTAALDRVRDDAERNARRLAVLDEYADAILFGGERLPASGAFQPSVDWFVGDGSGHVTTSGQSISECADKFIALLDGEETAARTQPEGSNG